MSAKLPWNEEWILEHYSEFSNFIQMVDAYNDIFGTSYNRQQMRHHFVINMGLSLGINYTEEQKAFVIEHYSTITNEELVKLYNERFYPPRTIAALRILANHKLNLKKTHDAFIKTHQKPNTKLSKPVGSVNVAAGKYASIKCSDGVWRSVSHVKYKEHHGEYPLKGYKIIFLNGDTFDYSKENLVAVPKNVVGAMNCLMGFNTDNPEIKKLSIAWTRLYLEQKKQKK